MSGGSPGGGQGNGIMMMTVETERFVAVCCECGKIRVGGKWRRPDEVDVGAARLTHGYCPACFRRAMRVCVSQAEPLELASKAG
jgi:hypothetical protein